MENVVGPQCSTKDTPERYGGLLICGLNYGTGQGKDPKPEMKHEPWAEYFTHYKSNRKGDRFVSRLAKWFEWWGIPLETKNGDPTELNVAISQTNLFYDSSNFFNVRVDGAPSENDWKSSYSRLTSLIVGLNISGLLLAGVSMADEAKRNLLLPDWNRIPFGKSFFGRSSTDKLQVAICPHPSYRVSKREVESIGNEVHGWVELVMKEYSGKQAQRKM